jgi:hypothetical protein
MRLTDLHGLAEGKMQKGNDVMSLVGYGLLQTAQSDLLIQLDVVSYAC